MEAVPASPAIVFVTYNVHEAVHMGNRVPADEFPHYGCVKNECSIRLLRLRHVEDTDWIAVEVSTRCMEAFVRYTWEIMAAVANQIWAEAALRRSAGQR